MKISGDIHNFVIFPSVIDNGDKLFSAVNDTSDKLLWVLLLPAINYALSWIFIESMTLAINLLLVKKTINRWLQQYWR